MNLPPDDLDREYHRASGADDSRPSERVRAAILENARKLKILPPGQVTVAGVDVSAPAANDSRWRWRAAAGIAAVGFAGVLAVLLYRGNPGPEPVATARVESADSFERTTADVTPAVPQTKAAPSEPAAPVRQREAAPPPQREEVARETGEAVVADEALDADRAAGAAARDSVDMAPAALTAAAEDRAPVASASANAIVRQHFPQALDSDEVAPQYWVLLSRDGNVLRSGQRNSTDQAELIGLLESSFPGIRTDEVQMLEFVNQRGRRLVIAQVFLAEGSPAP